MGASMILEENDLPDDVGKIVGEVSGVGLSVVIRCQPIIRA